MIGPVFLKSNLFQRGVLGLLICIMGMQREGNSVFVSWHGIYAIYI